MLVRLTGLHTLALDPQLTDDYLLPIVHRSCLSHPGNEAALSLYERLGYERLGVQMGNVLMRKPLTASSPTASDGSVASTSGPPTQPVTMPAPSPPATTVDSPFGGLFSGESSPDASPAKASSPMASLFGGWRACSRAYLMVQPGVQALLERVALTASPTPAASCKSSFPSHSCKSSFPPHSCKPPSPPTPSLAGMLLSPLAVTATFTQAEAELKQDERVVALLGSDLRIGAIDTKESLSVSAGVQIQGLTPSHAPPLSPRTPDRAANPNPTRAIDPCY